MSTAESTELFSLLPVDFIDMDKFKIAPSTSKIKPAFVSSNTSNTNRGRQRSNVWSVFTEAVDPHKAKCNVCKHCKRKIQYHKKSEVVVKHLKKCPSFRKTLIGVADGELPTWFKSKALGVQYRNSTSDKPASVVKASSSSHSRTRPYQTTLKKFEELPPMSEVQKDQFRACFALYYYATGTPFQQADDVHLKECIRLLRPDTNILPTPKELSTSLLDNCYNELSLKVNDRMQQETMCLITDTWSNIKNESIIIYMAVSPTYSFFLESVSTEQQGHDAKFIADDIERVMKRYTITSFAGAVTDNTTAYKKAWLILKDKFPTCYFQGCCSHGLHLLVQDIFGPAKSKKQGETEATYPDGYPFEDLRTFMEACKGIVKFFDNHHKPAAQLKQLQKSTGACALIMPVPTRWGSLEGMARSLLQSHQHLCSIVTAHDFIQGLPKQKTERQTVKNTVTDEGFVYKLQKSLAILRPVDKLIVKYQSNKVFVSEVMPDFNQLQRDFAAILAEGVIDEIELDYLNEVTSNRFNFLYGDAHGIAHLLDPALLGEDLSNENRRLVEDTLLNTPIENTPEVQEQIYLELTNFLIDASKEKSQNSFRYKLLAQRKKTPLQWWLTDGARFAHLQKIALNVFNMATSSPASEMNCPTMGFVHSKLRNSLTPERVEKLMFIKSNLRQFDNYPLEDTGCNNIHADDVDD